MSIPKEPRQLMINLMYLVLTALLALNVSAEIFNAFKLVDKGLKKSNAVLDAANDPIPAQVAKLAKKKPELQKYADRANPVREVSKEFVDYIQGVKDYMIDASGNKDGVVDAKEAAYANKMQKFRADKGKRDASATAGMAKDKITLQQKQRANANAKSQGKKQPYSGVGTGSYSGT